MSPFKSSFVNKFLCWALFQAGVFSVLLIADYAFYASYRNRVLPRELSARKMSELERKVGAGFSPGDKKSSFLNFPEKKAPGVVRIGCIGDSFTRGDEVNDVYDYPDLLAGLFRKAGYKNVEVLNFGKAYTGFGQEFMIWDILGAKYGLDYVLLGPGGINGLSLVRDLKFNHSCERGYLSCTIPYLHARYILSGGGVELKVPPGETEAERVSDYLSFIPSFQNLRYDLEAPAFLRAPIARLAPLKVLRRNPFYYKMDPVAEQVEINRRLIGIMADRTPNVVLLNPDPEVVELGRRLNRKNLVSEQMPRPSGFPYSAFNGHYSPSGNYLVARRAFGLLTGEGTMQVPFVTSAGPVPAAGAAPAGGNAALEDYKDVKIELNKVPLGRFYDASRNPLEYCAAPDCSTLVKTFRGVRSLLALKDGSRSFLDAVFIPLDFKLTDLPDLTLRIAGTGEELASVKLLRPGLNVGVATVKQWDGVTQRMGLFFASADKETLRRYCGPENKDVVLSLGGRDILNGRLEPDELNNGETGIKFTGIQRPLFFIKSDGGKILDVDALPGSGSAYLALEDARGKTEKVPVAVWTRTKLRLGSLGRSAGPLARRRRP